MAYAINGNLDEALDLHEKFAEDMLVVIDYFHGKIPIHPASRRKRPIPIRIYRIQAFKTISGS
jgi:hypothetical protein